MIHRHFGSILMCASLALPCATHAQDRAVLVDSARAQLPGSSESFDLLLRAAAPDPATRDSTWAVAVYDLADDLIDQGDPDLASVWLRWVVRHGDWAIDRLWYDQGVEEQYDLAADAAAPDPAVASEVTTDWVWPLAYYPTALGRLEVVSADAGIDVDVVIGGQTTDPTSSTELTPDTYELIVSAPDHDTVRIAREVLPGVTTRVSVTLAPQLSESTRIDLFESLAQVRFTSGGQAYCVNGTLSDVEGLVLTGLRPEMQDTESIQVETPRGTFEARIGGLDDRRGLAVLRPSNLDDRPAAPASLATGPRESDADFAWAIHRTDCGDPTSVRTSVASWPAQNSQPIDLEEDVPSEAVGGPLVDRTGAWMGVITEPGRAYRLSSADPLLADTRRAMIAELETQESGGIPTWVFVAGGGAIAAIAAALLLGGDETVAPGPDTGSLSIPFPPIGGP